MGDKFALLFKLSYNISITILHKPANIFRNLICELAVHIYRAHNRNSSSLTGVKICLAKAWSRVYKPCSLIKMHKFIQNYPERALLFHIQKVGKERLIAFSFKLFSFHLSNNMPVVMVFERHLNSRLRQDKPFFLRRMLQHHIINIRMRHHSKV